MVLVGEAKGKIAVLIDNMTDTFGTIVQADQKLVHDGAKNIYPILTLGIFLGEAIVRINFSHFKAILVTKGRAGG